MLHYFVSSPIMLNEKAGRFQNAYTGIEIAACTIASHKNIKKKETSYLLKLWRFPSSFRYGYLYSFLIMNLSNLLFAIAFR